MHIQMVHTRSFPYIKIYRYVWLFCVWFYNTTELANKRWISKCVRSYILFIYLFISMRWICYNFKAAKKKLKGKQYKYTNLTWRSCWPVSAFYSSIHLQNHSQNTCTLTLLYTYIVYIGEKNLYHIYL